MRAVLSYEVYILLQKTHLTILLGFTSCARDFCVFDEPRVLDFKLIYGIQNDPKHAVYTLVCQNREVLEALDPKDVDILRTTPLIFVNSSGFKLGNKEAIVGKNAAGLFKSYS